MEDLVAPSVMLADAARGRSIAGQLSPQAACPLVLTALKQGLRLLLLSGRHHLYVDCFGREIRTKLLLSEERFAWWANNLWVRIGGANYFNDETVERFLIKVLKRDMEGGHFTEREAARSAATVEALQMVREELRTMMGGVKRDKEDQASAEARRLQQQPAVPAALLASFESLIGPSIERELAMVAQLELALQLNGCFDSSLCICVIQPPRYVFADVRPDGSGGIRLQLNLSRLGPQPVVLSIETHRSVLAKKLAQLAELTGTSDLAQLREYMAAPLLNPFTSEPLENTDVTRLRA